MKHDEHIILTEKQELTREVIQKKALEIMLLDGEHVPTVFVEGTRGNATVLLPDLPEERESEQRYFFLKRMELSRADKHIGAVLQAYTVMKAWVGTKRSIIPKDDPSREEALVVSSVSLLTKEQTAHLFKLVRDTQGMVRELLPFHTEMRDVVNYSLLKFLAGYVFALKQTQR